MILMTFYQLLRKFLLGDGDGKVDEQGLKFMINLLVHIWVNLEDDKDDEVMEELIGVLKLAADQESDHRKWYSKVTWNLAVQTKIVAFKRSLFKLAAKFLPKEDPARISCVSLSLAASTHLALENNVTDEEAIEDLKEAIEEYTGSVKKFEPKTVQIFFVYRTILTVLSSNSEEDQLESLFEDALESGDPFVFISVAETFDKLGKFIRVRTKLLRQALSIGPDPALIPYWLELVEEASKIKDLKAMEAPVLELSEWLCRTYEGNQHDPDRGDQIRIMNGLAAIHNRIVDHELKSSQRGDSESVIKSYISGWAQFVPDFRVLLEGKMQISGLL